MVRLNPTPQKVTLLDKEEEEYMDEELKADLTRLWQLEEVGHNSSKHPDPAEAHYLQTSSRQESGRYVVSLPRKDPAPELGFSRPTALHHFVWNERSLQKKGKLHQMADDYQDKYPEAAAMVKRSFYVDDCLTGANTPEEALQKLQDLSSLVAEGQMVL